MKKLKKKKKVKKAEKPKRKGVRRAPDGKYPKGVCGNPKGRPKGSKNKYSVAELAEAIGIVEGKKGGAFLVTWVEAAWGDADKMANVAGFMMPKLRAIEQVTFAADSASDEEAEKWRKEMYERFHG